MNKPTQSWQKGLKATHTCDQTQYDLQKFWFGDPLECWLSMKHYMIFL